MKRARFAAEGAWWLTSIEATCPICFTTLLPNRSITKKYCSKRCLKRAHARVSEKKERAKPHNKIRYNLSKRLGDVLRRQGARKDNSILLHLGCTPKELAAHIERQFSKRMKWENYGVFGWHIDHIIPCHRFNLTLPEHRSVCFNFRNLRPLWHKANSDRAHWMNIEDRLHLNPILYDMAMKIGIKL